jgi:multidrug efflux pump subunit AcrB
MVYIPAILLLAAGAWIVFFHLAGPDQSANEDRSKGSLPVVTVEISYPGADAATVRDTIAAPVEQEVNGVEDMMYMVSCCANGGAYTLQIAFQPGTHLDTAQVLVQNRVGLAMPKLPDLAKMPGSVVTRKQQPGVLAIVCLGTKDRRHSALELSNYAEQKIKDKLVRVIGVADVVCIGPQRKGGGQDTFAMLNGSAVAALVVWPIRAGQAREVSAAIEKALAGLRKDLPEGMSVELSFDFAPLVEGAGEVSAADFLMVDVQMPDAASRERTRAVLGRCEALLRKSPGVKDVLGLSHDPFDLSSERACQIVRLDHAHKRSRNELIATLRRQLHRKIKEAVIGMRDFAGPSRFPYCAYPIDLAVYDTKDLGLEALRTEADSLAQRLGQSPKLADATARFRTSVPLLRLENGRQWAPPDKRGKVRHTSGPQAIMRFNMYPMAEITANPAPGVSLAEARDECERIARDTLREAYRLGWLSQPLRGDEN